MKFKILNYAINYSNNLGKEAMHCDFDVAPNNPLLIANNFIFASIDDSKKSFNGKQLVNGKITVTNNLSTSLGLLTFDEARVSPFLDNDEDSYLHITVNIGNTAYNQLLLLLRDYSKLEFDLYFPGLNFLNENGKPTNKSIWINTHFKTEAPGNYQVNIDRFAYSLKETPNSFSDISVKFSNAVVPAPSESNESIIEIQNNEKEVSKLENFEFRCPSCRTPVFQKPPTVCPECQLGIPFEPTQLPTESNSFVGSTPKLGISLKDEMPLDTYAKKLKKAGF